MKQASDHITHQLLKCQVKSNDIPKQKWGRRFHHTIIWPKHAPEWMLGTACGIGARPPYASANNSLALMIWVQDEVGPNMIEINKAMELLWTSWKWSACLVNFSRGSKSTFTPAASVKRAEASATDSCNLLGKTWQRNSFPNENVSNFGKIAIKKKQGTSSNFREPRITAIHPPSKPTKKWMVQGRNPVQVEKSCEPNVARIDVYPSCRIGPLYGSHPWPMMILVRAFAWQEGSRKEI